MDLDGSNLQRVEALRNPLYFSIFTLATMVKNLLGSFLALEDNFGT